MNKIFKLLSVLAALFVLVGLTGCPVGNGDVNINIGSGSNTVITDTVFEISNASQLADFLTNNYLNGKLTCESSIPLEDDGNRQIQKEKVLDLNGKNIVLSSAPNTIDNFVTIKTSDGKLTVKDTSTNHNGAIISNVGGDSFKVINVIEGGSFTLQSGVIRLAPNTTSGAKAVYVGGAGSSVTVTGGNILAGSGEVNSFTYRGTALYVAANGSAALSPAGTILKGVIGVDIAQGGTVSSMCVTVAASQIAVRNQGTITGISGGEYTLEKTENTSAGSTNIYAALDNSGSISNASGATFATSATAAGNCYGLHMTAGSLGANSNVQFICETTVSGANGKNYKASTATINGSPTYNPNIIDTDF